jgi:hypothetical protein
VVIGLCQGGKHQFLSERSSGIARLLHSGVAVCLPDVRGTGETKPGDGRRRDSSATAISASEQMLNGSTFRGRLSELDAVVRFLKQREDLNGERTALWGEGFAPANRAEFDPAVPLDADLPAHAEPLGGLLAEIGGLTMRVRAVAVRGGLVDFRSLLDSPFCYVPHDAIIPGALLAGDLPFAVAAFSPRPVRLEGMVDGLNRRVSAAALDKALAPALQAYKAARAEGKLVRVVEPESEEKLADWLIEQLK